MSLAVIKIGGGSRFLNFHWFENANQSWMQTSHWWLFAFLPESWRTIHFSQSEGPAWNCVRRMTNNNFDTTSVATEASSIWSDFKVWWRKIHCGQGKIFNISLKQSFLVKETWESKKLFWGELQLPPRSYWLVAPQELLTDCPGRLTLVFTVQHWSSIND